MYIFILLIYLKLGEEKKINIQRKDIEIIFLKSCRIRLYSYESLEQPDHGRISVSIYAVHVKSTNKKTIPLRSLHTRAFFRTMNFKQ